MNGEAQSIVIPSGTIYAELAAVDGDVTFDVDQNASSASQPIPEIIPSRRVWLTGNTSLSVYGESGAYMYYIFYGT